MATCVQCGKVFERAETAFCPVCGAASPDNPDQLRRHNVRVVPGLVVRVVLPLLLLAGLIVAAIMLPGWWRALPVSLIAVGVLLVVIDAF